MTARSIYDSDSKERELGQQLDSPEWYDSTLKDIQNLPETGEPATKSDTPEDIEDQENTASTSDGQPTKSSDSEADSSREDSENEDRNWRNRIRNIRVSRKQAIIGGVGAILVGGGIGISTFLSGPFKLLSFGSQLQQFFFSSNENFGNDRTSKLTTAYRYVRGGTVQGTRLGVVGTRVANRAEAKMIRDAGLRPVYQPGTGRMVGFEVLDENKARKIIKDLEADGIDVDATPESRGLTGATRVDGSPIESRRIINLSSDSARSRRSVIRSIVSSTDLDTLTSKLHSRTLIKLAGVDFHPLKNVRRRAGESLVDFYNRTKAAREERHKTGTSSPEPRDAQAQVEGEDNPEPDPDTQQFADETNAEVDNIRNAADLPDPEARKLSLANIKNSMATRLAAGAAAVVGVMCTVRDIGDQAEEMQFTNVTLPMIRYGFSYVAVASQIKSGQDTNLEELGSLADDLYDEDTGLGHDAARSYQYSNGLEPTGPDINPGIKPSAVSGKPLLFDIIDGIPFIGQACSINNTLTNIPIVSDVSDWATTQASNAVLGLVGTDLDTLMEGLIGWIAGDVVGSPIGAALGNVATYGARMAANLQCMAMGCRELTDAESAQVEEDSRLERVARMQDAPLSERLFSIGNPDSVLSVALRDSPSNGRNLVQTALNSPARILSHASGKAYAQAYTYDWGFDAMGFSMAERDNELIANPYSVAEQVEPRLEELSSRYESCFPVSITLNPTLALDIQPFTDSNAVSQFNGSRDRDLCNNSNDADLLLYRAYIADVSNALAADCLDGVTESCEGIGIQSELVLDEGEQQNSNPLEGWAFCGVDPDDPAAEAAARSMANDAGISATMGPCLPAPSNYSPANPGSRYGDPEKYMRLVGINAQAGLQTVVYDARVWSGDANVRNQAYSYWQPVLNNIRAWDMGDEFDPESTDWDTLITRWSIMQQYTVPATGKPAFTNHLPFDTVFQAALRDLPNNNQLFSYDSYDVNRSLIIARTLDPQVENLMCAINALDHLSYAVNPGKLIDDMDAHREAGCDMYLIFGGVVPYDSGGAFGTSSLVDASGSSTSWAAAVKRGLEGPEAEGASDTFTWPLSEQYGRMSGCWGESRSYLNSTSGHSGIDIPAPVGTPVLAAAEGRVINVAMPTGTRNVDGVNFTNYGDGQGWRVIIQHPNGLFTSYNHLGSISVREGDEVRRGQTIATVGMTGRTYGPHLHMNLQRMSTPGYNYTDTLNPLTNGFTRPQTSDIGEACENYPTGGPR